MGDLHRYSYKVNQTGEHFVKLTVFRDGDDVYSRTYGVMDLSMLKSFYCCFIASNAAAMKILFDTAKRTAESAITVMKENES